MARTPNSNRNASKPSKSGKNPSTDLKTEQVPLENVEILKQGLGFDIQNKNPESVKALVHVLKSSKSSSPYTSPDMLQEYIVKGFPELPDKIIQAIDEQRSHRQRLELLTTQGSEKRQDRAQIGAQVLGGLSVVGALLGGYLGVSFTVCAVVVVIGVGGPNAATVAGRILDKWVK